MGALFLVAACAVAVVCGASSSGSASTSSSSGSASTSSSTDVGDCNMGEWLANPLLVQCGVDGSYNFSSGVQPTVAQAEAMCDSSSCSTLFQAASLSTGVHECTLPYGDHILLLADLVDYVLEICSASTSGSTNDGSSSNSSSNATDATAAPSVATDSSSSSDGDNSTPAIIGVVVGVVVLLVLIAGLLWWRRRRQKQKRESTDGSSHHSQQPYAPIMTATGRNELLPGPVNTLGQSTNSTTTTGSGASLVSSSQASKKQHARLSDLAPWRVNVDDIQDLERIGHGAHGVVWRVMYRGATVLASKRIQTDQISPKRTQDFIDEIALISRLQHPNIVKFVGVGWTMESDLQVLLEFMDGGDLRGYLLKTETPRTWTMQKLSIAHDVAQALSFVHSFQPPLLHRDLKSQNVMLIAGGAQDINTPPSSTETPLIAKLTDFGVSRFHSENNTMTVGVGTSRWLAPEVIVGKPNYGPEADMYSFGVVLSELDTHELPYDDARTAAGEPLANVAILQRVAMGHLKPTFRSEKCPPALLTLAHQCLEHDWSKRPTAAQVASELLQIIESFI
jgi:hypothetical protein